MATQRGAARGQRTAPNATHRVNGTPPVPAPQGPIYYEYTDVTDNPLFRVVRKPGKRFHQERWNGSRYVKGVQGVIPVLYNLPTVFEAALAGATVYVCAGEKDADHLTALGLTATTNPGGECMWDSAKNGIARGEAYAEALRGVSRIVICWDNDRPDKKTGRRKGRDHALGVERWLRPLGVPIDFRTAEAEGEDISDHLDRGLPFAELVDDRPGDPLPDLPLDDPGAVDGPREGAEEGLEPAVYQLAVARLHEHAVKNGLPMPRRTDKGWEACCPHHDDQHPSLGIRVGDDHPLVVKCQADCTDRQVISALGIPYRDAFHHRERGQTHHGTLTIHTPAQLAEAPPPTTPLIRGVIAEGSYGPFGGKEKTLKSICADAGCIALASGKPMLGYERWSVPEPKTVLKFAGEGGIDLAKRRLQRIAKDIYAIGDISTIPLYVVEGTAELNSDYFRDKTMEFVVKFGRPALVDIDSLYNFHDGDVEVTNLYARGRMLSDYQHFMQRECGPACALWVIDHFRKAANSIDLDEYMQSGMAQWADSWWNAEHRQEPDLDQNRFWLNVKIGSRHPYGGLYEIDIDEGPYDEDVMAWLRPMTAHVERVGSHTKSATESKMPTGEIDAAIVRLAENGQHTKTDIKELVGAGSSRVYTRLIKLLNQQQLKLVKEVKDGRRTDIVRPHGKVSMRRATSDRPDESS